MQYPVTVHDSTGVQIELGPQGVGRTTLQNVLVGGGVGLAVQMPRQYPVMVHDSTGVQVELGPQGVGSTALQNEVVGGGVGTHFPEHPPGIVQGTVGEHTEPEAH